MAGGGSPVDAYYYFLKYTMKQGILMGLYQFLIGMGWLSDTEAITSKVEFISEWIFESWGDDSYYYKTSKLIWVGGSSSSTTLLVPAPTLRASNARF